MNIGIIGAGKVGCAIALGLKNNGILIKGAYSRSSGSVAFLCERIGTTFENNLELTIQFSDIILITVPDGEIANIAEVVAGNCQVKGKTFLHMSGALPSDALKSIEEKGGITGSLHPIQTFADKESGWKGLDGIHFGFEGSEEARISAEVIVELFNGELLNIEKSLKPLYHAAACILSNYTVTLSYITGDIIEKLGIAPETGMKAFMPLLSKTVDNISKTSSIQALTGPISRGDYKVVEEHIKAFKMFSIENLEVYKALGRRTLEAAIKKGNIDQEKINNMKKVLEIGE